MTTEELEEMRQRALDMKHVLSGCVGGDGRPAFENSQSEHILRLLQALRESQEEAKALREALRGNAHLIEGELCWCPDPTDRPPHTRNCLASRAALQEK